LTAETDAEIAVALAPADRTDGAVRVVRPAEVKVNRRGRDNWEREVHSARRVW
jgi:5-deoxy-D-glucuronate isomerase